MASIGGDILEVTYNHPTIGNGSLFPKAGESSTFNPGGFRTDDSDNSIDGSGQAIYTMSRERWSFSATYAWDSNDRQEIEKLNAMAGSTADADWTITHVNGTVYAGKGRPVGKIEGDGKDATTAIKIAGGGQMKKI